MKLQDNKQGKLYRVTWKIGSVSYSQRFRDKDRAVKFIRDNLDNVNYDIKEVILHAS